MSSVAPRAAVLVVAALFAIGTRDRNKEYRSALTLATTSVERYPTGAGRHMLAVQLLAAGRRDEALGQLQLAVPGDPRAYYTLGQVLFEQRRWSEAIAALQQFVTARPFLYEAIAARVLLGQAYRNTGQWQDAIAQYRVLMTMHPTKAVQVEALNGAAIAFVASHRVGDAVPLFLQAARLSPSDGALQRNLAYALFENHDLIGAATYARKAVELRPGDSEARDLLDEILAAQRTAKSPG